MSVLLKGNTGQEYHEMSLRAVSALKKVAMP